MTSEWVLCTSLAGQNLLLHVIFTSKLSKKEAKWGKKKKQDRFTTCFSRPAEQVQLLGGSMAQKQAIGSVYD